MAVANGGDYAAAGAHSALANGHQQPVDAGAPWHTAA